MSISRHQAVGAYRRWEPPQFDEQGELKPAADPEALAPPHPADEVAPALDATPPAPPPADEAPDHSLPDDFHLPTAEEIERMQEAAREEARAEGHAEGYAAGMEAGRKAGYDEGRKAARAEAARLAGMANDLEDALTKLDTEVAEELMALALALTRKMVRDTLAQRPEAVLDIVRAALQELPHNHARIRLHPEDAALAREYLGDQLAHGEHRLIEDESIRRGGCVVEAGGTGVDGTLETRWRRVVASLGRSETEWDDAE